MGSGSTVMYVVGALVGVTCLGVLHPFAERPPLATCSNEQVASRARGVGVLGGGASASISSSNCACPTSQHARYLGELTADTLLAGLSHVESRVHEGSCPDPSCATPAWSSTHCRTTVARNAARTTWTTGPGARSTHDHAAVRPTCRNPRQMHGRRRAARQPGTLKRADPASSTAGARRSRTRLPALGDQLRDRLDARAPDSQK